MPQSVSEFTEMVAAIERNEFPHLEAVIVKRRGQTLFEGYFGDTTESTRIDAKSVGKSITALALGMAIEDGSIEGVDLPLYDFFRDRVGPEALDEQREQISLRDVLTMSSALDCDDWRQSPGNEERMYRRRDWTKFALEIPIDSSYRRGPRGYGRFSYCTAGAFLIGRVIEKQARIPFESYVQQRIFDPLDIKDPQWRRAPNGEVQSGGQLALRARDFARLGELVQMQGEFGGQRLVSKDWIREMLTPKVQVNADEAYGYFWWVRNFKHGGQTLSGFYMSGNGGNKVIVFPEIESVVVVLSTNYNRQNMHVLTTRLIESYVLPGIEAAELASGSPT